MRQCDVIVIDYGVGNLLSVRRALERCGARVVVSDDHHAILAAPRVILPGVGAFADGMNELRSRGLDTIAQTVAEKGTPLLGICLGMEMLLDESEEFAATTGLGLIHGRVIPVPPTDSDGHPQKIPHIGWNRLVVPDNRRDWNGTPLATTVPGEAVYFVHSYMASPSNCEHRVADCLYGGISISAVIQRDNIFGCQFHPEKSGEVGLNILRQFLLI